MKEIGFSVIAFIIGSIPFGVLIAKTKGIDLRRVGSGNIGATNVLRAMGWKPALATLAGDLLKGTAVVVLARKMQLSEWAVISAAISVVLGHNYSVFLKFRGGKGVATSVGVVLGYAPLMGLMVVVVWIATAYLFRYSSLSALVAFTVLPVVMFLLNSPTESVVLSVVLMILLYIRHHANIRRLIEGTEPRIGKAG